MLGTTWSAFSSAKLVVMPWICQLQVSWPTLLLDLMMKAPLPTNFKSGMESTATQSMAGLEHLEPMFLKTLPWIISGLTLTLPQLAKMH